MQYLENNSYFAQNRVLIDLDAIRHNFRAIKGLLREDCQVLPVIKSDAYGHGIVEVSKTLINEGVWGLSVFDITEAFKLIENNIHTRIFLLAGLFPNEIKFILPENVILGITNWDVLKRLDFYTKLHNRKVEAHLKIDVGMSRFGFSPNEIFEIIRCKDNYNFIEFSGLYSHLPCADSDKEKTLEHIKVLNDTLNHIKQYSWYPKWIHTANSAATINFPQAHFNLVRPGIAIYGYNPSNDTRIDLRPVMQLKSRLIEIKCIKKGSTIGYGCGYLAKKDLKIGIVPIGYDDGFMRLLSNNENDLIKTYVIIKGRKTPILGKVCMKAIIVSLDGYNDLNIGEEVTIVGRDGDEEITLNELALKAKTICYELMCLLGTRNKRVFI